MYKFHTYFNFQAVKQLYQLKYHLNNGMLINYFRIHDSIIMRYNFHNAHTEYINVMGEI